MVKKFLLIFIIVFLLNVVNTDAAVKYNCGTCSCVVCSGVACTTKCSATTYETGKYALCNCNVNICTVVTNTGTCKDYVCGTSSMCVGKDPNYYWCINSNGLEGYCNSNCVYSSSCDYICGSSDECHNSKFYDPCVKDEIAGSCDNYCQCIIPSSYSLKFGVADGIGEVKVYKWNTANPPLEIGSTTTTKTISIKPKDDIEIRALPSLNSNFEKFCGNEPSDWCCYQSGSPSCTNSLRREYKSEPGSIYAYFSCTPDCTGKECGSDGCGGSCGSCDGWDTCNNGVCTSTCGSTFGIDTTQPNACKDDEFWVSEYVNNEEEFEEYCFFDFYNEENYYGQTCNEYCLSEDYDGGYTEEYGNCDVIACNYYFDCNGGNYDCICTQSSENDNCGTTDCRDDCCIGTTLYKYTDKFDRTCKNGACQSFISSCTPTTELCSSKCYSCGDGTCDSECGEDCSSCPQDCGACPFDFSTSLNPSSGSVIQGSSTSTTVNLNLASETTQSVALSCSDLPVGVACSFSQPSCNPTCSSTLTISTSSSTPAGSYSITVTGSGDSKTSSATYTLTVNLQTCSDSDNGQEFESPGTCTDSSSHQDSCSGATLTEWYCTGTSCLSTTHNCDNDDYFCSVSSQNLQLMFEDHYCSDSNPDYCASSTSTVNIWTCDSSNECVPQKCDDIEYMCYRSNDGSWNWGSEEVSETSCNDGNDNDCDGFPDFYDTDCGATCTSDGDCPADGWSCSEGNVKIFKDYSCSEGQCVSTDTEQYDCDDDDGCSGSAAYDNYMCSEGSCEIQSSDDCSDCSCSCGGFNTPEAIANKNCGDGLDNDCNGYWDNDEPDCLSCTADPLVTTVKVFTEFEEEKPVRLTYAIDPDIGTINVEFEPDVISPSDDGSSMKITADATTPTGVYNIRIIGKTIGAGDVATSYTTYTLVVNPEEIPVCSGILEITKSGSTICSISATLTASNCNNLDWEIKEGTSTKLSGTVSGDLYTNKPTWSVSSGTYTYTLLIDGNTFNSVTTTCSGPPEPTPECDDNSDCTAEFCKVGHCTGGTCSYSGAKNVGQACGGTKTTTSGCSDKCSTSPPYPKGLTSKGGSKTCTKVCTNSGTCDCTLPSLCSYDTTYFCNYGCNSGNTDCVAGIYCQPATAMCRTCWWGTCGDGKAVFNGGCFTPGSVPAELKSVTCNCAGILGISKVVSTCSACNFGSRETECRDENNGCEPTYDSGCQLSSCSSNPTRCPSH